MPNLKRGIFEKMLLTATFVALIAASSSGQTNRPSIDWAIPQTEGGTSLGVSHRDTPLPPPEARTGAQSKASTPAQNAPGGLQPKRILWVIPNYRAVSASVQLPPLSPRGKLWLATQDSFDYSSFILAGIVAGISQAQNSTPQFGDGMAAYGQYFWHTFVDEAVGNYLTEGLLPIATRQDPRYYTLGPQGGGFLHRTGYAISRLAVTRTDSGHNTFNSSEIVGNAIGAGLSNLYYPPAQRTLGQTGQKFVIQLGIDAVFNVAKEFWPDIDQRIFHGRYRADQ